MLPISILGCVVLVPMYVAEDWIEKAGHHDKRLNPSLFMKLTMTNVDDPNVLWVTFFLVLLFVLYTCWVLNWHYYNFVVIRQYYMRTGRYDMAGTDYIGAFNPWVKMSHVESLVLIRRATKHVARARR